MARHRFTLAALATLAVPGLDVAVTRTFTGGGDGQYDAALLTDRAGEHLVVRAPTDRDAAARLATEYRALGALTAGVRARLPFAVPTAIGRLPAPAAVVTSYLPGGRLQPAAVQPGDALAAGVGRAVAALHDLPTSVVSDAGLAVVTAQECARAARDLIRRADSTGRVPHELVGRWTAAVDDPAMWRFRPAVVHGALGAEHLLVDPTPAPRVSGVLGWSALSVGDPARDLAWVLSLPAAGAAGAVLEAYGRARGPEADPALAQRALLHAELDLAAWLLHGVDVRDGAVVDDAVQLLEALLAAVLEDAAGSLGRDDRRPLTLLEVERMLDARHQRVASGSRTPVAAHAARSSAAE